MDIVIIAAVTADMAIGAAGDMLYHIRPDLQRFKTLTMGCPVVMGRKTFQSLPKGALPGRRNIVISRNKEFAAPGAEVFPSLTEALRACAGAERLFVIGGGEIYRLALPMATTLEITEIDAVAGNEADTHFPDYDPAEWHTNATALWHTDDKSGVRYRFTTLYRR